MNNKLPLIIMNVTQWTYHFSKQNKWYHKDYCTTSYAQSIDVIVIEIFQISYKNNYVNEQTIS